MSDAAAALWFQIVPRAALTMTLDDAKSLCNAELDVRDFPPTLRLSDIDVLMIDHVVFYPSDDKGEIN